MKTRMMIPAALAILLAACGGGLEGTFEDQMGMSAYTFHGDGTVVQSTAIAGMEVEMKYEVDDDKVRLLIPNGNGAALVLTRIDANTLSGPMGLRLERK